jgi:hypothetical protein
MSKAPAFIRKLTSLVWHGRLEPAEVVLAISAVLHGLWITFTPPGDMISSMLNNYHHSWEWAVAAIVGGGLTLSGSASIGAVVTNRMDRRKISTLFMFCAWLFLSALAFIATPYSIFWIGYLTIATVSGATYLSLSAVGHQDGD